MKIKISVILLGSIILFQGCSQKVQTVAVASSDQKTFYDGSLTSEKRCIVTLSLYNNIKLAKEKTIFQIIIQNRTKFPVKISKENISVIFQGNNTGKPLKNIQIESPEVFMAYLEDTYYNEEHRLIYDILRRASRTADDIEMRKEEREKKMVAAMFEPKLANTVNKIKLMRDEIGQLKETVPDIVIKQSTILPSDTYIGIVVCDTAEISPEIEGEFKIIISVDGENHEFTIERRT